MRLFVSVLTKISWNQCARWKKRPWFKKILSCVSSCNTCNWRFGVHLRYPAKFLLWVGRQILQKNFGKAIFFWRSSNLTNFLRFTIPLELYNDLPWIRLCEICKMVVLMYPDYFGNWRRSSTSPSKQNHLISKQTRLHTYLRVEVGWQCDKIAAAQL